MTENYEIQCPHCHERNLVETVQETGVCRVCDTPITADLDDPEVVVLCGSTKFKDAFREENKRLSLAGKIVISVGMFGHADGLKYTPGEKRMLDKVYKRKIDIADRIHVVNVDGYVGKSTRSEIEYAREHGKDITWREPEHALETTNAD